MMESPDRALHLLLSAGAAPRDARAFEDNLVFDDEGKTLLCRGILLRLRKYGDQATLTVKSNPVVEGGLKVREEREARVDGFGAMRDLLTALGYAPVFRYQKYRTNFESHGNRGQPGRNAHRDLSGDRRRAPGRHARRGAAGTGIGARADAVVHGVIPGAAEERGYGVQGTRRDAGTLGRRDARMAGSGQEFEIGSSGASRTSSVPIRLTSSCRNTNDSAIASEPLKGCSSLCREAMPSHVRWSSPGERRTVPRGRLPILGPDRRPCIDRGGLAAGGQCPFVQEQDDLPAALVIDLHRHAAPVLRQPPLYPHAVHDHRAPAQGEIDSGRDGDRGGDWGGWVVAGGQKQRNGHEDEGSREQVHKAIIEQAEWERRISHCSFFSESESVSESAFGYGFEVRYRLRIPMAIPIPIPGVQGWGTALLPGCFT